MAPSLEAQNIALLDLIKLLEQPSIGPQKFGGPTNHRGLDKGKAIHTPYRVLLKGKVKSVQHSPLFGNVVEVDHGLGRIVAYCHVLEPVRLNTVLVQGGTIGKIAGPADNYATGSVTNGLHEHFTLQRKVGDYLADRPIKDPTVFVDGKCLAKARRSQKVIAKKLKKIK